MKKFEKLSRAEMKNVTGGLGTAGCYTSAKRCYFTGIYGPIYGYCGIHPATKDCYCSDISGSEFDVSSDCNLAA